MNRVLAQKLFEIGELRISQTFKTPDMARPTTALIGTHEELIASLGALAAELVEGALECKGATEKEQYREEMSDLDLESLAALRSLPSPDGYVFF